MQVNLKQNNIKLDLNLKLQFHQMIHNQTVQKLFVQTQGLMQLMLVNLIINLARELYFELK